MGILTDPGCVGGEGGAGGGAGTVCVWALTGRAGAALSLLLVAASVGWLLALPHPFFNNANYFSENALLPGLVKSDLYNDRSADQYLSELEEELKEKYATKDNMPVPWLAAKLHQLHLDVYTHNFTLNYPLGKGRKFRGENVYGILRAGRTASTEAIVISAPFRPASSHHRNTNAGIALILAFAKFAKFRKYWAKDLIFLFTEHEQLGAQAWLEAYHGVTSIKSQNWHDPFTIYHVEGDLKPYLNSGDLKGRAGSIQAAINLEMPSLVVRYMDIKIEGLNGQLPNLDLVNLVHKMCTKAYVYHAYKTSYSWMGFQGESNKWNRYFNALKTLLSQMGTQATGVPTGNHGLFHRYGIEAVTLEGVNEIDPKSKISFPSKGGRPLHALEGIVRSLNNLLERFHQSFFFYLRPAADRFVSIAQYFPPLGILSGALFIRAFSLWLSIQQSEDSKKGDKKNKNSEKKPKKKIGNIKIRLREICLTFIIVHVIGYLLNCCPQLLSDIGVKVFELPTEQAIFYGFSIFTFLIIFVLPIILNSLRNDWTEIEGSVILILGLIELGTLCLAIGMQNFSLGYFLAVFYTPIALSIGIDMNRFRKFICRTFWLLLNPIVLIVIVVMIYTYFTFPEENFKLIINRGLKATGEAIMYSIVDSMIYGNWVFNVITAALCPTWMIFHQVIGMKIVKKKKKTE